MSRSLIYSGRFTRALKRFLKRQPGLAEAVGASLALLSEDMFDPSLRSHKLKGTMAGSWACSGGFDLRITFALVRQPGSDAELILLEGIGTHEDVYGQ